MKTDETHYCEEMIYNNWRSYKCDKKAKVERDGKWYCGIHDPVKVEARRKEREKIYNEKIEKLDRIQRRRQAEIYYCQRITTDYLETHVANIPDQTVWAKEKGSK